MTIINDALVQKDFNNHAINMIQHEGDLWMTMADIGACLEYNDPQKAIQNLYKKHEEELASYSCTLRTRVQGGSAPSQNRMVRLFNEEGVMILTMLSRQPKAREFRSWAVKVLKAYRNEQLTLTNHLPAQHDKFLESMVKEAGKQNKYAKLVLEQRYGITPPKPKHADCHNCGCAVYITE